MSTFSGPATYEFGPQTYPPVIWDRDTVISKVGFVQSPPILARRSLYQALDVKSGVENSRPIPDPIGLLFFLEGRGKEEVSCAGTKPTFLPRGSQSRIVGDIDDLADDCNPPHRVSSVSPPLNRQTSTFTKPEGWYFSVFVSFVWLPHEYYESFLNPVKLRSDL